MEEKSYWLAFSMVGGIGPKRFDQLLSFFGSAKNAWNASPEELMASGIGGKVIGDLIDFRKNFSIEAYEELLRGKGVSYMTVRSDSYPMQLAKIHNPPFVLYVKGNDEILNQVQNDSPSRKASHVAEAMRGKSEGQGKPIAIVGTRKITDYGRQVTEIFTRDLVDAGCIIVSGLALGVDALAHQATLDAGGKTVAVLGCGVDCCYPRENERLYNQIIERGGVIVSEYGLGVPPNQGSFPSRNRIIAGLSLGVLVTEGAVDSGSLITAKDALENNRPVFAVPGPITSTLSKGPYELIQKGAKLVVSAKDVLVELGFGNGASRLLPIKSGYGEPKKGDTAEEQMIIDLLTEQNLHFDELVKLIKLDSSEMGGILSLLEMKGVVRSLEGGAFSLV